MSRWKWVHRSVLSRTNPLVLCLLPFLVLIPLLDSPIALWYHAQREGAGYFQALAFSRLGVDSLFTLTPAESLSALHLHSLLSMPFIELGFVEGGRIVSLLAGMVAIFFVAQIGQEIASKPVGFLSAAILLAHPLFITHSYAFMPETLSIALTAGCILATVRYVKEEQNRYLWIMGIFFVLGVANHMWEATILLPIVAYLYITGKQSVAVLSGIFGFLTTGLIRAITRLQPQPFSLSNSFGFLSTAPRIIQLEWWIPTISPHPFTISFILTLPLGIFLTIYYTILWTRNRSSENGLIATWIASGIAIPLLLPGGFPYHRYYIWGIIAPTSLGIGLILSRSLVPKINTYIKYQNSDLHLLLQGLAVSLILISTIYAAVFHLGVASATIGVDSRTTTSATINGIPADEAKEAGYTLQDYDATSNDTLLFIGNWRTSGIFWGNIGRVLVYSDIMVVSNDMGDIETIQTMETRNKTIDCDFRLIKQQNNINVNKC